MADQLVKLIHAPRVTDLLVESPATTHGQDRPRCVLYEGHDSSSFDRDLDQRTGAYPRPARVRKLADGIIETQVKEIDEMKQLIGELERDPVASGAPDLPPSGQTDNATGP